MAVPTSKTASTKTGQSKKPVAKKKAVPAVVESAKPQQKSLIATLKLTPHVRRLLMLWLPFAILTVGLGIFTYTAVQQDMRLSANDPQIELAENAANDLGSNSSATGLLSVVVGDKVNMAKSLSPFILITDSTGKVLDSTGQLNGTNPVPPLSALKSAAASGEGSFTWQPASGVREAAVVVPYTSSGSHKGYVVVARSLAQIDKRENELAYMAAITLLATLIASFLVIMLSGSRDLIQ
jgi:hypothetical protein